MNIARVLKTSLIFVAVSAAMGTQADDTTIEVIEIRDMGLTVLNQRSVSEQLKSSGAQLMEAGGVSGLVGINGMFADRVKVTIDGGEVGSSCANQMNSPVSYVTSGQISSINLYAGTSPVSAGGDNIGGVVNIDTLQPRYNESKVLTRDESYLEAGWESNLDRQLVSFYTAAASDTLSLQYLGNSEQANSYSDANDRLVRASLYSAQNHQLAAAYRFSDSQLQVKLTHQYLPFQGFPNQYMDMTHNQSNAIALDYQQQLSPEYNWGMAVNWRDVEHEMGFFSPEKTGNMPMLTDSKELNTRFYLNYINWQFGVEYHDFTLDDYWPAVAEKPMMSPNDFININDGQRDRLAGFIEYEYNQNQLTMIAGARFEQVTTDTGPVQSYSNMPTIMNHMMMSMPNLDLQAAQRFNELDRKQTDHLTDLQLGVTYTQGQHLFTVASALKNRAPNLYERYSWGQGIMATTMIGWYGDGNGYLGNVELAPETALTSALSYQYQTDSATLDLNAYVTSVEDYIDVSVLRSFNRTPFAQSERNLLQFINVDAILTGYDASIKLTLSDEQTLMAQFSTIHGKRTDTETPLYNMQPDTLKVIYGYQFDDLTLTAKWEWVGKKTRVDPNRLENQTDAYQLVKLNAQYRIGSWSLDASVNNLFDEFYELPLAGVSVADYRADPSLGFAQLPGMGRSVALTARYTF